MILIDFMDGMFTIPSQWLPHCIVLATIQGTTAKSHGSLNVPIEHHPTIRFH